MCSFALQDSIHFSCTEPQDTLKIEELEKEAHQSSMDIPVLEEDIVKLSKQVVVDEEKLERIIEESRGNNGIQLNGVLFKANCLLIFANRCNFVADEVERYQDELTVVRLELEPWEVQLRECQGRIDLATTESSLLQDKVGDVGTCPECVFVSRLCSSGCEVGTVFSMMQVDWHTRKRRRP